MAGRDSNAVTVLLVVPDQGLRALLIRWLEDEGVFTRTAEDGAEALADITRARPDAVVTSLSLPGVNGYELIQRIRASPEDVVAGLPVIVVSARRMAWDVERGAVIGASRYLTTPVDPDRVVSELLGLVSARRRDAVGHGSGSSP